LLIVTINGWNRIQIGFRAVHTVDKRELQEILAAAGRAEAETLLDQALRTACSQQARSLELRAATDLARLWMNQGKCAEALDVLASIHGRFTEGFDTRDLKEAKAVLVQ
jgi:predicted ATPase